MEKVVTAVLGGGQGARLWPLTRDRAKPAVPVGGKFRLIDIPISNSLHAGIDRIYVLTQFNSATLHRHISQTYRFDTFRTGFVNILAAEQTLSNRDWYQGTADAVRQNLERLRYLGAEQILVLSGDQLYTMDLAAFVDSHRSRKAQISIAVKPVRREEAKSLGILRVAPDGRIVEFVEKPQEDSELDRLAVTPTQLESLGFAPDAGELLASMGIYVFDADVLSDALTGTEATDFGKEVIPSAIEDCRVYAFGYDGYWRDIGTIPAFHQTNIELTMPWPPLNLYDMKKPVYTHPRFLPGTKVDRCEIHHSILCEGSILSGAYISSSIIGLRAIVREESRIESSILMGGTSFEISRGRAGVPLGVGRGCQIRNAIIDTNARIGEGCRLVNERGVEEEDGDHHHIRGGVIVVPRGAELPPGTVI